MTIEIVDVIDHRNKYVVQVELVLNRLPKPLFERQGNVLIGNDDCCVFQFYRYERPGPNWQAFAGREFDIPMADGSVEHAKGQWWQTTCKDFSELTYSHGLSTIDDLQKCYVFYGGFHIDRTMVDEWREKNEPSNNYYKYDKRHPACGQHRIVSPWEPASSANQTA